MCTADQRERDNAVRALFACVYINHLSVLLARVTSDASVLIACNIRITVLFACTIIYFSVLLSGRNLYKSNISNFARTVLDSSVLFAHVIIGITVLFAHIVIDTIVLIVFYSPLSLPLSLSQLTTTLS